MGLFSFENYLENMVSFLLWHKTLIRWKELLEWQMSFICNGFFSPYKLHLLSPQVVALSRSFIDMTPYAFDDTYESSCDDDDTALATSRSIQDRIIASMNSMEEWKNKLD